MRSKAEACIEELQQLIALAAEGLATPDSAPTRAKYEGVQRSVAELERLGIPVPEALTTLLDDLHRELAMSDAARDTLVYLQGALAELCDQVNGALPRRSRGTRAEATDPDGAGSTRMRAASPTPRGFILTGTHYPAQTWIELLVELSRVLAQRHGDEFERALQLRGQVHSLFSRDPSALPIPRLIPGTSIYVNAKKGQRSVTNNALALVHLFGYGPDDFAILEPD